jgi:DNA modification methylase
MIKLSTIKPNPNNPRIIRNEKFEKLKRSIEEFPEMMELRPIVVDETNTIIGGNMRFRALQELGKKEVPNNWIKKASELTENQKKRFVITDNASFGEWEWEAIKSDWDLGFVADWGVDIPEFEAEKVEAKEDDYEIPDEIKTDIVLGDLFEIGEHRLLCGDSTDSDSVAKLMNGEKADMVMTDPPYNVAYKGGTGLTIMNDEMDNDSFYTFLLLFYKAFADVTKDGGAWYVWHADSEGVNFRKAFQESGLLMKQCLIWVKNALVMGRQDYHWKHEPCLYGWKAGAAHYFTNDRTKTTVIHHDKPLKNGEHPTMKPILLLAPLIENSSKPKWIVGDPFLGSGSTMVAAHQLNRKCYGMELDPKYCQVIIDRMLKLDPSLKVLKNGKPYINTSR